MYDVFGREVATLVEGRESVGIHAVEFKAENLASGVYFCRLSAGRFVDTKRMILLE